MTSVPQKPISEAIGWNAMAARKMRQMSVRELASIVGVTSATILNWERSFSGSPDDLVALHRAFGLPLWELVPTPEEAKELMKGGEQT